MLQSGNGTRHSRRRLLGSLLAACALAAAVIAPLRARAFNGPTIDYITGVPGTIYASSSYPCRIYLTAAAPADCFAEITGSIGITGDLVAIPQGATYVDVSFTTGSEGGTGSASLGFAVGQYVDLGCGPQPNVTDTDSASLIWGL